ncbi:P-loop containing nucleoside triphosphate hydrolase protein [Jimgerdemannia flammicorona]|uniref:P-loop containing nucleoside triphosphate hydrolase protein n=1 Tax=Jimgerdemannia flammicorona TaxID=994334 RepID=A0A433DD40_9FUNG|nr:P-loop containing nucleoside triphosphate hydrolase protein [Jimgerdemannia flammicorona]
MSAQYFAGGGSAGSSFVNSQNTRRRFSLPSDEPPRNPTMANFPKPSESTPWSCPAPSVPAIITNARPVSVNPSTPRLTTVQENQIFADKSNRLLNIIKGTNGILNELRETNKNRFLVSYPVIDSLNKLSRSQSFAQKPDDAASSSQRVIDAVPRDYLRRSNSLSLPPSLKDNAQVDPLTHRLLTPETAQAFNHQLNVLKLDLKVGNLSTDVASLEKESIATLLDDRLAQSIKHLDNLHSRVADKSSKVLVTGDLNAGKSTFVNALLRRDLMPTDQQPCTTLFCEVLDATENDGVQEVHAVPDPAAYVRTDESTYDKVDLRHLYKYVTDGNEQYAILKIYTADKRSTQESLLHNGVVDIAVIDSPGLNRDSLKTTALFARQEEIDVVVFVVSAENHFTLSVSHNNIYYYFYYCYYC